MLCVSIKTNATLKLSFEKLKPVNFQYKMIDCVSENLSKSFARGPSYGTISLQCNSLSQIHSSVYFRLKIVSQVEHT